MRLQWPAIILTSLFISCGSPEEKLSVKTEDKNIVYINADDDEMNKAKQKAKDGWDHFLSVLKRKDFDEGNASVKLGYPTNDGNSEHIWANDLHWIGNDLYAVINNFPENIPDMRMGDTVLVTKNKLSDWLYAENGVLRGGYTIRVIRKQMTPEERKSFDEEFGLKIEEE
jgi:uncharacterized protein YegJ (DUF2314 family)